MLNQKEYVPVSTIVHDFLMGMYKKAMLNPSEEESKLWCERLKGVFEGWRIMRKAGVFPENFTKTFHLDITNVMQVVHEEIDEKRGGVANLAEHQKIFTFNMATLQSEFGRK
jgi:hypothetical protein